MESVKPNIVLFNNLLGEMIYGLSNYLHYIKGMNRQLEKEEAESPSNKYLAEWKLLSNGGAYKMAESLRLLKSLEKRRIVATSRHELMDKYEFIKPLSDKYEGLDITNAYFTLVCEEDNYIPKLIPTIVEEEFALDLAILENKNRVSKNKAKRKRKRR